MKSGDVAVRRVRRSDEELRAALRVGRDAGEQVESAASVAPAPEDRAFGVELADEDVVLAAMSRNRSVRRARHAEDENAAVGRFADGDALVGRASAEACAPEDVAVGIEPGDPDVVVSVFAGDVAVDGVRRSGDDEAAGRGGLDIRAGIGAGSAVAPAPEDRARVVPPNDPDVVPSVVSGNVAVGGARRADDDGASSGLAGRNRAYARAVVSGASSETRRVDERERGRACGEEQQGKSDCRKKVFPQRRHVWFPRFLRLVGDR